ncbi:MAG: hypothetical protein RIE31_05425 [Alphaproteobacteria bacterium]
MLHLTGEDATADRLRIARPDDTVLPWHDRQSVGPAPSGLSPAGWLEVRATALAGLGSGAAAAERDCLTAQAQALEAALQQDEIVLWPGPSVNDQLNLVQVLAWLSGPLFLRVRLSLADFAGDSLETALDNRLPLGPPHLRLADLAWRAFRSDNPIALETMAAVGEAHDLTGLAPAFRRLLREFPSMRNGLSRSERLVFMALEAGARSFDALHNHIRDLEPVPLLERRSLNRLLASMAGGARPLLRLAGDAAAPDSIATADGLAVAHFEADALALRGVDRWIGGVHVHAPHHIWRFDNRRGRLYRLHTTAPPD